MCEECVQGEVQFPVSNNVGTTWATMQLTLHDHDSEPDVILSGDYSDGIEVPAGETWRVDGLVTTPKNVVVHGTLVMRTGDTLHFRDVDDEAYVGGGKQVLASDVGLWVVGHGTVDLQGTPKTAWTRCAADAMTGATVITVEDAAGWLPGDDLAVVPTAPPGHWSHQGYDHVTVVSVDGQQVTIDRPLEHDHPRVTVDRQVGDLPVVFGAEVLNLTRDVKITGEGRDTDHWDGDGHPHIMFLHVHHPPIIRHVELRHLGPMQKTGSTYKDRSGPTTITRPVRDGVFGRYPLHFHHCMDGTRGTVVEGVVIRQAGERGFVPHASFGITFNDCIAHDVYGPMYWWDSKNEQGEWDHGSHDTHYHRTVGSLRRHEPPNQGNRSANYILGHGENVAVTDSVAVGGWDGRDASGFNWPEGTARFPGTNERAYIDHWVFQNNVAHNGKSLGLFTWQNTDGPDHVVEDSVCYHNRRGAIGHGAYGNQYLYRDMVLHGDGDFGVELHAQGRGGSGPRFYDMLFDGAGIAPYGFTTDRHRSDEPGAEIVRCRFVRYTNKAIFFVAPRDDEPEVIDIVEPEFDGPEASWFWLNNTVNAASVIRVQLTDGSAFRLHPAHATVGTHKPEWNARVEPTPPFNDA